MIRSAIWFCLLLTILPPLAAAAQSEPLVGDRPDFTESALTITTGRVQVEAGLTHMRTPNVETNQVGEVLGRIGLAPNTELRVGLGSFVDVSVDPSDIDGFDDMSLGVKQRLIQGEGSTPTMAVIAVTSLPTGSSDIGTQKAQPSLVGVAEWGLSDRVGLGTNLGWSSAYNGTDYFSSAWLSASLGYALAERVGCFVEGYGYNQEEKDGDSTKYMNLGVTFQANEDLQFDVRYGLGFNDLDDDWFAGAGVVYRH